MIQSKKLQLRRQVLVVEDQELLRAASATR